MKEELIRKYTNGTATHEEARRLLGLFREAPTLTPEEKALKSMLQLESIRMEACPEWAEEDESALFDNMVRRRRRIATLRWLLPVAATVALVWLVSDIVEWKPFRQETTITYIYGNKIENEPLAMDMMQQTMSELLDRPALEDEMGRLFNE